MNKDDPLIWAANQVHKHLASHTRQMPADLFRAMRRLMECQQEVACNWRQIQKAQANGWSLAVAKLQPELFQQIRYLESEACTLHQRESQSCPAQHQIPNLSFLLEELKQLQADMEGVQIQPKEGLIVAHTQSIELEGLYLGPFAIQLHVGRLANQLDSSAFEIVALDPHPASCNEDVTHPHVQAKALCAGEASVPIAFALKQGRLADAFTLVRSVLETYNEQSPYVSIEDWDGVRCEDCDSLTNRDDLCSCEHCDRSFCSDCMSFCDICETTVCRGCTEMDEQSDRRCCPNCRHTCRTCGRTVDSNSFVAEEGLCPECHDEQQEKENQDESEPETNTETESSPAA